eukprot:scaffold2115_cov363-Pavlova_lutheri.AAC.7
MGTSCWNHDRFAAYKSGIVVLKNASDYALNSFPPLVEKLRLQVAISINARSSQFARNQETKQAAAFTSHNTKVFGPKSPVLYEVPSS